MRRDQSGPYAKEAGNCLHWAPGVRPIQPVNVLGKMRQRQKNDPLIITEG